ncbi:Vesicular-fusion protein SEC18 [Pleurotus pulmonarius]
MNETFSADEMAADCIRAFNGVVFSTNEIISFEFHGEKLGGVVKSISTLELAGEQRKGVPVSDLWRDSSAGILMDKTDITLMKAGDSAIKMKYSAKKAPPNAILASNFKFEDMGIGGLDTEFAEIFRRAFASRVFSPALVEKLGITHVKGLLLHGPPGTGKTLIARRIGKMLNAREPKIVDGPEILSKYVGASEENIRKLFADAEKESKEKGNESGLHIIIFDELDAIFKQLSLLSITLNGCSTMPRSVHGTPALQALSLLCARRPPKGHRLLVIATTSKRALLNELDLFDVFTSNLYVPPISRLSTLADILEELQMFRSSNEKHQTFNKLRQAGFEDEDTSSKMHVRIKKLLSTIEMARKEPENVVDRLTGALLVIGL